MLETSIMLRRALLMMVTLFVTCLGEDVTVQTSLGAIKGIRYSADLGIGEGVTTTIDQFLGVPYAEPPINKLRFANPKPVRGWDGVLEATSHAPSCPQDSSLVECHIRQSEDCLYLNIYSPYQQGKDSVQYPVMVYIHGGSYVYGCGRRYNGSALAQYGVVVIAINYRLGPLGFLSSGDKRVPGNFGLWDQIEALRWVQNHIRHFRGDPGRVTIMGNSAGGASVGLLMMSPVTEGLFHRVVAQSGSANAFWATSDASPDDLRKDFHDVAAGLDCIHGNFADKLDCMRRLNENATRLTKICKFRRCEYVDPPFKPVVDGSLVPRPVAETLASGEIRTVPYISGVVVTEFEEDTSGMQKEIMDYLGRRHKGSAEVQRAIQFAYTDWTDPAVGPLHPREGNRKWHEKHGEILSDIGLVAPTSDMTSFLSVRENSEVYMYVFSSTKNFHSMELNYIFGVPFTNQDVDERQTKNLTSPEDKTYSRQLMKMWIHFAKDGSPASEDFNWTKASSNNLDYLRMHISGATMQQRYKARKVALWTSFIPHIMENLPKSPHNVRLSPEVVALVIFCIVLCIVVLGMVVYIIMLRRNTPTQNGHVHQVNSSPSTTSGSVSS